MPDTNDVFSHQEKFSMATRSFGKNVSKLSAAIASMDSILTDKFGSFKDNMKDILSQLTRWTEVFTMSHIVMSIQQLVEEIDNTGAMLTQTYGLIGNQRKEFRSMLTMQESQLAQYGISISKANASTIALINELRDYSIISNENLTKTNAIVKEVFGFSEESSARLVGNLRRFGGSSEKDIRTFFDDIVVASKDLDVSFKAVGDNIANNSRLMTMFDIKSGKSLKKFVKMAAYATSIGLDLGSAAETTEKFLALQGATTGAAELTRYGIGVNPLQLMQMAQSGPGQIEKEVLDQLSNIIAPGREGTTYARMIARGVGESIGMSGPELLDKLNRQRQVSQRMLNMGVSRAIALEQIAKESMTTSDRFKALYKLVLTDIANPIANAILPILEKSAEWVSSIIDKIGGIGTAIVAAIGVLGIRILKSSGLSKLGGPISSGLETMLIKGMGSKSGMIRGASERLAGKVFPGSQSQITPRTLPGTSKGPGPGAGFNLPSPASMLASAAAMVAFAGSMWILSKAFQNFSDGVSWKGVAMGITTMAAFAISMTLMTAGLTAAAPEIAIGTVLLAGLAGATWIASKAFQNFSSAIIPLDNVNLYNIAGGLSVLGLAMAGFGSASIFSGLGSIVQFLTGNPLEKLGEWAEKYSDPIISVSYAVERLANSMQMLSNSVQAIDISKARKISSELLSNDLSSMIKDKKKNDDKVLKVKFNEPIIIEMDGEKVGGGIIKALGIVR